MGVVETVTDLLHPVVASLGVELVDVEWSGSTLRLVVDAADGVTTDQLAKVNRMASPILDQHDPVPGRYTLEVSSPGVERNLARLDHFERAVGEDVVVKTIPGVEPRRIKGELVAAVDNEITIAAREIDGTDLKEVESRTVGLADIGKARTVFDWGPAPKPGGGKSNTPSGPSKHNKQKPKQQGKSKKNKPRSHAKSSGPATATKESS